MAKEGDNVKVGTPLAMIGEKSEIIEEQIVSSPIKEEKKLSKEWFLFSPQNQVLR
jgi:pyruvate/2-oxoglutarate dehydrogenase complex dihydrolipoamide acyltransferase (E2) component